MTKQLDKYDLSACCQELDETIDALTNWYVRLSRKRFAGKEGEEAKQDALTTLYTVLIEFTKLLAPICPFISEHIYCNLRQIPHDSVHLQDWPEVRTLTADEAALLAKTRLLRTVVSLGLSVRGEASVKNRQPLAKATIALPPTMQASSNVTEADIQLLQQELNVKEVEITMQPEALATTIVLVDARKVGPRLGKRVQDIITLGKNGAFTVNADGTFTIDGDVFTTDEAMLVYRGKEDGNIAAKDGIVVHLDTHLSQELQLEGTARDLIRTIQRLRKEAGFAFTDLVRVHIQGAQAAVEQFSQMIASETNSVLEANSGTVSEVQLDNETITITLQ
jgi:isoleucyl-tRNA synthetase